MLNHAESWFDAASIALNRKYLEFLCDRVGCESSPDAARVDSATDEQS